MFKKIPIFYTKKSIEYTINNYFVRIKFINLVPINNINYIAAHGTKIWPK